MELLNIGGGRALILTVGIITLAILMLVGSADAAMLTVNASGGADYKKIQDAINNASKGDTIFVRSGIYNEDIRITRANITLRGEDMNSTFIFGSPGELASQNFVVDISINNVIFSGFTIDRQADSHAAESNIDGVNTYNKSETGREKVSGFEIISAIAALFLVLVQKMRKKDKHEKR